MAFKLPCVRQKISEYSSLVVNDLPLFDWSDLTDRDEIGRGTFGSVFVAKYGPASEPNGETHVVIKKLLGTVF